ncbi:MAG: tagaturonate epimerase family protein [Deltaproteobacteria bacterium]|nr:tagaturonate epimerase family protein [Deltaproteobacteria bacterium]
MSTTLYWDSLVRHEDTTLFMARDSAGKFLAVHGKGEACDALEGSVISLPGGPVKRCPLTNANAAVVRRIFPFTRPVSRKGHPFTIGLGDRLGLASAGHIRLVRGMDVFPVLAQQSIRELNLTGRTYEDVLSAAGWAVFQEGYRAGYGADGDHLKTREEVQMALDCGFTMITLDCSEHIRNDFAALPASELESHYQALEPGLRTQLEGEYLNRSFPLDGGQSISFSAADLRRIVLVYHDAIRYTIALYDELLRGRDTDFEMSIDETLSTTSPEAHYFVARELQKAGVELISLAPRFCGEFQKGSDYRGNLSEFEKEFAVHATIAKTLGYKLSIHSGSDKFAVFPIIYRETGKMVHLKTAGTNWLEALRVVAAQEPGLFREILAFALERLPEAKKYYHITENTANIPDIGALADKDLPSLLDQDDARQVLHVTYGQILLDSSFKGPIFKTLERYEDAYCVALEKHIGRHISGA